ncbi:unnamed protein product [marine sediment metagenome]|uniref:Uncharacterized protein n=1 Tax=marine sediment metagenome TaxID=412755 RepID=X1EBL6_9ZZZZ
MYQQKSEYKVEIKLANRVEVNKNLIPKNTSEKDKLFNLRNNPDILISFKNSLTESKLPIFFSEIIFTRLGLFSSHSIEGLIDREKQSGRKSNKKHVQFRGVIEKKDMEYYQKVSQISLSNMKKLISNSNLFSLVEKHHYEHEKYKQDGNYKKSLRY